MMTLKRAKEITGHGKSLGKTTKMPGYSTGLPAKACKTGAKLHKIPGSVCAVCYALKGNYMFQNVQDSQYRRLAALDNPEWVSGMVRLVGHYTDVLDPYFRFQDSGDLQSVPHLLNIVAVARELPWVKFWVPTKEPGIVMKAVRMLGGWQNMPSNLVIRVSVFMKGDAPPKEWVERFKTTSSVNWEDSPDQCPAYRQDGACGSCRNCWDPEVSNVNYPAH
jgi:hypothetical protein